MKKYIFLIICWMFHQNFAEQLVYPVADFDDGNQLMLLYQKSLEDVELWIWDTHNHTATKGLSSFLVPANLRILPSGKGFSFIDQGYIKIKEFVKRSPRTLPIYESIGSFSSMNWINDEMFYFVARQGDYFQIFQGDLEANIQQITFESIDALYPQKIENKLFYMKRDKNHQVTIVVKPWTIDKNQSHSDEVIIQEPDQQLCFLHMIDELEGFYIQAPTYKIESNQDCYEFSCHHILNKNNNEWVSNKLFTFKIPSRYITGSDRLYESIEPFLPNYTNSKNVYFCDWHNQLEQFQLYTYNIETKNLENITEEKKNKNLNRHIFAPYSYKNTIYCGIILNEYKLTQNIFEQENDLFQLPLFKTKM